MYYAVSVGDDEPRTKRVSHTSNIEDSLLDMFIATALPGGVRGLGQRFHYRDLRWMRDGFIETPNPLTGRPWTLTREHVRAHLEGRLLVAPRCPELVDFIEVDLDAKDPARVTLGVRAKLAISALEARRLARAGNVIALEDERRRREGGAR